jgi:hypothetical protein
MRLVTIRHPEAGIARCPESAVPFHASNGWTVIPDPPPPPRHAPRAVDNADRPAAEAPQSEPPKVRRANKKEESN